MCYSKMKNISICLFNKDYHNRQHLFLQDPKSDLFVVLKQKIYPLHKAFLTDVKYFSNPQIQHEKVHMLDPLVQAKEFEAIMGYFYGKPLEYPRTWGLEKLIGALQILQVAVIEKKLYADIKNSFDDYGFFLLVQIAYMYKLKWLRELCEEELTLMNFQQLNYNRYDLFQVGRPTLEEILKLHQLLKINQNIVGQNQKILRQILLQYCKSNQINESEVDCLLATEQSTMNEIKQDLIDSDNIRKRNNSEPQNLREKEQKLHLMNSTSTEIQTVQPKQGNAGFCNEANSQLQKLQSINSEISIKGTKLLKEINYVKQQIDNTYEAKNQSKLDGIQQKFKKLQKLCHEQDQKYLNLKKEMERMSPSGMKSASSEKDIQKSTKVTDKSTKALDSSKNMFIGMPKLQRD